MSCKDKLKLTPEEERLLNEQVFKILCDGLDVVRARSPTIKGISDEESNDKLPNDSPANEDHD